FTTFNVGRVGGGSGVNVIPSDAWMEIDLRSSSRTALAALDTQVQRAVATAVREENQRWNASTAVTVAKKLVGNRPVSTIAESAPIVQTARAVARALGLSPIEGESSSDANFPMSLGIPAITIGGGGRSTDSHTTSEAFDATESWRGTQNALLLTVAL